MPDRVKKLWSELNVDVTVNKRELVLGILTNAEPEQEE